MAQQTINIGAAPNDGTGTPLRTSFDYTNQNFTELYAGGGVGTSTNTQVIFNDSGVLKGDAGLVYNKTTDALTVTGPLSTGGTLAVTGVTTLTGAATVQGLFAGKGTGAVYSNTVFGTTGLQSRTAAISCTIFGSQAGGAITTGNSNTLMGQYCGEFIQGGASNTIVGSGALSGCVSGNTNSACGQAGLNNATGSDNSTLGGSALIALVAGDSNTAVGKSAGSSQTAGSNNAFFGAVSYADNTTGSNQYNYGNGSVATHKFRNGDVVAANGSLKSSGASAGLRITSSTGDMYQTVAGKNSVLPNITSITIVFTVAAALSTSVLVDVQMGVSATFCDFCFVKYANTATVILRSSASAGITGALTVDGTGTIYTMTIAGIPSVSLMVVALKVSLGGSGSPGGALFTALPVITFIP